MYHFIAWCFFNAMHTAHCTARRSVHTTSKRVTICADRNVKPWKIESGSSVLKNSTRYRNIKIQNEFQFGNGRTDNASTKLYLNNYRFRRIFHQCQHFDHFCLPLFNGMKLDNLTKIQMKASIYCMCFVEIFSGKYAEPCKIQTFLVVFQTFQH